MLRCLWPIAKPKYKEFLHEMFSLLHVERILEEVPYMAQESDLIFTVETLKGDKNHTALTWGIAYRTMVLIDHWIGATSWRGGVRNAVEGFTHNGSTTR